MKLLEQRLLYWRSFMQCVRRILWKTSISYPLTSIRTTVSGVKKSVCVQNGWSRVFIVHVTGSDRCLVAIFMISTFLCAAKTSKFLMLLLRMLIFCKLHSFKSYIYTTTRRRIYFNPLLHNVPKWSDTLKIL